MSELLPLEAFRYWRDYYAVASIQERLPRQRQQAAQLRAEAERLQRVEKHPQTSKHDRQEAETARVNVWRVLSPLEATIAIEERELAGRLAYMVDELTRRAAYGLPVPTWERRVA